MVFTELFWYVLAVGLCSFILVIFLSNRKTHKLTLIEQLVSFAPYLLIIGWLSSVTSLVTLLFEIFDWKTLLDVWFWLEQSTLINLNWFVIGWDTTETSLIKPDLMKLGLVGVNVLLMYGYWTESKYLFSVFFKKSYITICNEQTNLKVAVFNILGSNRRYQAIESNILLASADVVGLVELTPDVVDHLKSNQKIHDTYPYQLLFPRHQDYRGLGVYSKFPIKLLYLEPSSLFLTITMIVNTRALIIILAHPLPPKNRSWNEQAQQELIKIRQEVVKYSRQKLILMGDFNLTPWSKRYQWFTENLPLHNVAFGRGWQTTWMNLLWIDHIFVSPDFAVGEYQKMPRAGSDHNLIAVSLKI